MAEVSEQTILNEAALKRLDPYVKEVLDTAKFVALYTFKIKENKWEKTGVEGSLFVYSRTGEPFYNILVLNRLSTNNLIEPISSKLTLQLHEPFLLYLNSKCCLYGIWFYEKEECTRLASLIENLMKELGDPKQSQNNVKPPNGSCIDICSILTRAEEAYKSSKNNSESTVGVSQPVDDNDQTPQSVMDFFAKAGSAPKNLILSPQQFPLMSARSQSLMEGNNGCHSLVNPLIHQLMSNPVHLVEHIEKQQRMAKTEEIVCNNVFKSFIKESESNMECNKKGKSENGSISNQVPESVFFDCQGSNLPLTPECHVIRELPKKPELMPPAMFTPQYHKDCDDFKVEPLTRNQLIQAINYLLRNDPVFMTKIHEAYVKSLTDRVL